MKNYNYFQNHTIFLIFTAFYGKYRSADTCHLVYYADGKMGYNFAV